MRLSLVVVALIAISRADDDPTLKGHDFLQGRRLVLTCSDSDYRELLELLKTAKDFGRLNGNDLKRLDVIAKKVPGKCFRDHDERALQILLGRFGRIPCDVKSFRRPIKVTFFPENHDCPVCESRSDALMKKANKKELFLITESVPLNRSTRHLLRIDDDFPVIAMDLVKTLDRLDVYLLSLHKAAKQEALGDSIKQFMMDLSNNSTLAKLVPAAVKAASAKAKKTVPVALIEELLLEVSDQYPNRKLSSTEKNARYEEMKKVLLANAEWLRDLTATLTLDFKRLAETPENRFEHDTPDLETLAKFVDDSRDEKNYQELRTHVLLDWRDRAMARRSLHLLCDEANSGIEIVLNMGLEHVVAVYLYFERALHLSGVKNVSLHIDRTYTTSPIYKKELEEQDPAILNFEKFLKTVPAEI